LLYAPPVATGSGPASTLGDISAAAPGPGTKEQTLGTTRVYFACSHALYVGPRRVPRPRRSRRYRRRLRDCQAQQQRQRGSAAALRSHQRRTRQQADAILGNPCPTCTYDPCVCAATDEATDLRRDDEAYGQLGEDLDDVELWGEG